MEDNSDGNGDGKRPPANWRDSGWSSQNPSELQRCAPRSSVKEPSPAGTTPASAAAAAAVGANPDLICRIAGFMDTAGGTLYSLCISVGPRVATKIRRKYLGKNETYVVKSLTRLDDIPHLQKNYPEFVESLPLFDKCRSDIQTWMEVNPNWRSRISQDNIRRFTGDATSVYSRGTRIRLEPNVVFNNPAVAIEIGLKDVVETLVADYDIDFSAKHWASFTSKDETWNEDLIKLAVLRGDATIVETLLTSSKFDMRTVLEDAGTNAHNLMHITTAYAHLIETECTERLFLHPNFDANFILHDPRGAITPLLCAMYGFENALRERSELSFGLKVVDMLLANGADPEIPLDHVKIWWATEEDDEEIKERLFLLVLMLEGEKIEAEAWENPSEVVAKAMEGKSEYNLLREILAS